MQVEFHFQDQACPIVHVASSDTKRSRRWSSRALWWWKTPSHLMPQFGTSLLFMWSGEAGNMQSPAQFTVRYPTLVSFKNNGENMHLRHGQQQAASQGEHKVLPRLHTPQVVNRPVPHLPLHSGGLELFLCPSRLHGTEVLQEMPLQTGHPSAGAQCRGLTVMLGHAQNQGQTLQTPLTNE